MGNKEDLHLVNIKIFKSTLIYYRILFDVLCFRGFLLTANLDLNLKLEMETLIFWIFFR